MPRRYEESHPWITFSAKEVKHLAMPFWMLVGEARSKCDHLAGTPLRPDIAEQFWRVTLIKGARATTAIEGNTLTEDEVAGILDGTYRAPQSRQYQEQEVRNMLDALTALDRRVMSGKRIPLTVDLLHDFNRQVLRDLELPPEVVPGEIRTHSVGVGQYRGAPSEDCDYLLARLCEWLESADFVSEDDGIQFALLLIRAVLAHLYFAWIHPYGDGNGRTARLMEFLILARSGRVPLPAAHLLSNHYNLTRDRYYAELDKASKTRAALSFLFYAIQGFVDGIRDEIGQVRAHQFHVSWINFVHDAMSHVAAGNTCERQRSLVLAMAPGTVFKRGDLTGLTSKLASMYASKGDRTLTRDLNRLMEMRLIRRAPGGYIAYIDQLAAFMPPMPEPDDYGPKIEEVAAPIAQAG